MGYKIVKKEQLSENVFRMEVVAPRIAKKHQAGQFVVLRVDETGERIPLTVVEANPGQGTITLIFQVLGKTTMLLKEQGVGGEILDVAGPLGHPTHIQNFGTAVCIGGGIGLAALYPITKALKLAGNKVVSIIGAQRANLLILENEMKAVSDQLIVTTDDGSKGLHGLVTVPLQKMIDTKDQVNFVIAIGPWPMMKAVSNLTRPYKIKTMVSLNSIMIDGTGMCGGCRVSVAGKKMFTCVDGPEFDGHEVDFDNLAGRLKAYAEEEKCPREQCKIR